MFLVATDSYVRHDGLVLINAIPNGGTQCYRARLVGTDGRTSAWSNDMCGKPAEDPYAPVLVQSTAVVAHSRIVSLTPETSEPRQLDNVATALGALVPARLGTVASPITQVRIGRLPTTTDGAWQPLNAARLPSTYSPGGVPARLPDTDTATLFVQAEDRAGNRTEITPVYFRLTAATSLDRAVRLEERAEDQIAAGALSAARTSVDDSLPLVRNSFARVAHDLGACASRENDGDDVPPPRGAMMGGCRRDQLYALKKLGKIAVAKVKVRALLHGGKAAQARALLAATLEDERALATWAAREGVAL